MTQTPAPLKRTLLRDVHVKAAAKMVPFGGWDMPVQYTGIIEEHRCVRSAVGLFDISHMGEFEVRGPGALGAVQRVTSNDAYTIAYAFKTHDRSPSPARRRWKSLPICGSATLTMNRSRLASTTPAHTITNTSPDEASRRAPPLRPWVTVHSARRPASAS